MAEAKKKKEKHEIILEYLEGERESLTEQMQKIDSPISEDNSMQAYELLIMRQKLYSLNSYIKTIRLLIGDRK